MIRFTLLIGCWMLVQSSLAQDSIRTWVLTPLQLYEDWDSLKAILNQTHSNPNAFFPDSDYQAIITEIEKNLDREMRVSEFFHLINPLFLSLKDVHSRIWIPRFNNEYVLNGGFHLPVQIRCIDQHVFILADKDTLIPKGSEILAINNIPISTILDSMLSFQYTDGNINNTRVRLLEENFFSQLPLYFPLDSLIPLQIGLPQSGKDSLLYYPGVKRIRNTPPPERKRNKVERSRFFELNFRPEDETAIIRIYTFSGGSELAYRNFLRHSFRKISKKGTKALIIDLRGNKGGYINRGPILLAYIADEPFNYASQSIVKSSPLLKQSIKQRLKLPSWVITFFRPFVGKELVSGWQNSIGNLDTIQWKLTKPKHEKRRFTGEVYLLTDGLSISNSSLVRSAFSFAGMGVVVGMPCGGTANGTFGNAVSFQLPHSHIAGRISTIRINSPSVYQGFYPEALPPEYQVSDNIRDLIEGKDTQLEFTLGLIRSQASTGPSTPVLTPIQNP